MFRFKYSSILIVLAIISMISIQQAFALKCWYCGNDEKPNCGDPFDSTGITDDNGSGLYGCGGICFKLKARTNGKEEVSRGCADDEGNAQRICANFQKRIKAADSSASFDCTTCNTDACNGAVQYGAMALLIALPVAIAKILLI